MEYLSEAIAAAAALKAAVRLGVLDQLDAEVATVQELAAACGIDEAGAERLLNALAGLGLLEFYDGRWRGLQPDLSGIGRMTAMWDHLDVALREGRPLVRADTADGAAAFYPEVVGNLGRCSGPLRSEQQPDCPPPRTSSTGAREPLLGASLGLGRQGVEGRRRTRLLAIAGRARMLL